jgi:hypothetical protein
MLRFNGRAAICTAAVLFGCATDPEPLEVSGECADAYGGDLCTWAILDGDRVVEAGATVLLASIENAPADVPMTWPPATVAAPAMPTASGLSHLTMYWEPMGHAPVTYMTPHFDFHFYLTPQDHRLAIDCSDRSKPATLPAGYSMIDEVLPPEVAAMIGVDTLIGVCVPEMGMHSLVTVELASETPFSGTIVVGYYGGKPIFIEPMISRAALMERRSFDLTVPTVPGLEADQPTVFRAVYDEDMDAYRFTFSSFSRGT